MEETMRRQLLRRPNSAAILPEEIMVEIVSWLPVKHVMQLRCVNKFFKTLIFDSHFVRMHLNKSSRNSQLALTYYVEAAGGKSSLVTLSIPRVLQNQFTTFHHSLNDYYYYSDILEQHVVGSCNGLLLISISSRLPRRPSTYNQCIYFWNPAMRTKSKYFQIRFLEANFFKLSFGYDILTLTYKVVAFHAQKGRHGRKSKSMFKVFSLGENSWRDIQCPPVSPLDSDRDNNNNNNGVHLNGTINWLALNDCFGWKDSTIEQCVIVSLDLSTETYTQLLLPRIFDKVSRCQPKLVVLKKRLCFCHDFEKTHFVIWQIKDFGVQDSWIRLFKISYENSFKQMKLPLFAYKNIFKCVNLLPLYLSENGDTLILVYGRNKSTAFIYNRGHHRVEKIQITNHHVIWSHAKDYVESLVSTH